MNLSELSKKQVVENKWFWTNYEQSMTWVKKHEVAYWKSHALALAEENRKLLQIIHDGNYTSRNNTKSRRSKRNKKKKKKETEEKVEVSKELVDFFKQSIQHKRNLQKEKEKQLKEACIFTPPQEELTLRIEGLKEIYGNEYSKIMGMETAMKLSYERYVDRKAPQYWPKLPLKL